jgi:hypothetical protein
MVIVQAQKFIVRENFWSKQHAMPKGQPISIRFDDGVREGLQQLADADRRKLSQYVELVLVSHLKEKGLFPPNKKKDRR